MPYHYVTKNGRREYSMPLDFERLTSETLAAETARDWPGYYQLQEMFLRLAVQRGHVLPEHAARAKLTLARLSKHRQTIKPGVKNYVRKPKY